MPRPLKLNAFTMNCVSHITHGLWTHPRSRAVDYADLGTWVELARSLDGVFDAIFLADVTGTYDVYGGGYATAAREALQLPVGDPMLLVPAMAYATEHLGFAFTASTMQEHPYLFARRVTTLDHLTKGRVAWNIVTGYLDSGARNIGLPGLPPHAERYARAAEYVDVAYKLWEGSWEDDAVVRDRERRIYADPAKVHRIDHHGAFYDVEGPHLCEPSPQRTPVIFQAGASPAGRDFCAQHAEATFITARSREGARAHIDDVRARAVGHGRAAGDVLFFQALGIVVGGTEEEARRTEAEIAERFSLEAVLAHQSGELGIDLARYDPATPLGELDVNGMTSTLRAMVEAAPDQALTFGDLVRWTGLSRIVGTPEQVADRLEEWAEAGIDGVNLVYAITPGTFTDVVEHLAPELRRRGLLAPEPGTGTLRERLTGGGPRLPATHPAARHRRPAS